MDDALVTRDAAEPETGAEGAAWNRVRAALGRERDRVQAEIRIYPLPIPACDAHFNQLLEERGRITDELARLDDAAPRGAMLQLEEFLRQSSCLDDRTKREILAGAGTR